MIKGKITAELLQKIKDSVNILEVVGEHVVLRKSGANYTGLCPFHSERSPSFSVHERKGLYHCYGCKKSGDIVTFVMDIHGLSFPEAVEDLAERAKIVLPNDWNGGSASDDPEVQRKRAESRERLHVLAKLNLFAMAFYRHQLKTLPIAEKYFSSRGVQGDLATNFRIGAAQPAWDGLARHMSEKKAPMPQAVELGLIRPSTKQTPGSSGYFDLFRNRAMFPIIDMRGRVAGFGGRKMPLPPGGLDTESEGPKYMNSPESLLFQKSKLAFGLFQAQKHIREKGELILVEGYFDVLALHAAGFENVVATCGTSITPEHLNLFKRFAKRITILFDGDRAGVSATERAMEVGLDHGMILYGAAIPEGLDPDELLFDQQTGLPVAGGKERMATILAASQPLLGVRLAEEAQGAIAGPEARTQALKKAAGWLGRYTDPVGREVWVEDVLRQLGVSRGLLAQAMGGGAAPPRGATTQSTPPLQHLQLQQPQLPPFRRMPGTAQRAQPVQRPPAVHLGDKILMQALAKGGEYIELFVAARAKLPPKTTLAELFEYPAARDLVGYLLTQPGVFERFRAVPETILNEQMDPQVRSILTEALISNESLFEKSDFQLSMDRAFVRIWARFSQRIKTALADAEAKQDAGLHSELMKEYLDVQRKIKEFNSFYDEA